VCLTYAYFAAALLMAGIMFLFGPLIVRLLAGPRYAEAGTVIGWIALGHAFGGMYLMVTNYVFYSKRTGLLSLSTISAGIINRLVPVDNSLIFINFMNRLRAKRTDSLTNRFFLLSIRPV